MQIDTSQTTTIAALATGHGGAIALLRLSGPDAVSITETIFSKPLAQASGYTVHFGTISDGERLLDEVLVTLFRAPHSYTGEDMVEISCHGSDYIVQEILALLIRRGAVPAAAGEFTRRAFLNGKLDLSQAEAVADLIASESASAHRIALNQMRGGYAAKLTTLRAKLLHITSLLELELDFSEEDVEFADRSELRCLLEEILERCQSLAASFRTGNVLKNGVPVAIAGAPNAGKSTLLNRLIGEERAIVSDIAGTTRDFIEETITLSGIRFRFIDTAGLRHTDDTVEALGIELDEESMRKVTGAYPARPNRAAADSRTAIARGSRGTNSIVSGYRRPATYCSAQQARLMGYHSIGRISTVSLSCGEYLRTVRRRIGLPQSVTRFNHWLRLG